MREVFKEVECPSCKAINDVRTVDNASIFSPIGKDFSYCCADCGAFMFRDSNSWDIPRITLVSKATDKEQNLRRLADAYNKTEVNGWVYFVDFIDDTQNINIRKENKGLFRVRTDGSCLMRITDRDCRKFEIKDGMLYVYESFTELADEGWRTNYCSGKVIYTIDGDKLIEKERSKSVGHSVLSR